MNQVKLRHELKYHINYQDYLALRNVLKQFLKLDRNANLKDENRYHIRSLYFDDIQNSALWEKISGNGIRQKYRIRIYNLSDQIIMLEKKSKQRNLIAKSRQIITKEECEQILQGKLESFILSDKRLLRELFIKNRVNQLKPVVLVDYKREAYVNPAGNVRITFDQELKTGLFSTELFSDRVPMIQAFNEAGMILEIKYDEYLPDHIRQAIHFKGRHPEALSKYVQCRKYTNCNQWEDN